MRETPWGRGVDAIILTVHSINVLGDALRDYLDVRELADMGKT